MCCDPDDSGARQARKVVVLVLLGHVPRNEVAVGPLAPGQPVHDALLRNFTFETDLESLRGCEWQLKEALGCFSLLVPGTGSR